MWADIVAEKIRKQAEFLDELVIENPSFFSEFVGTLLKQIEGERGNAVLSIDDKPVELSRYADITLQFAPFELNRKSLLNKLCVALEEKAVSADFYIETSEQLARLEAFIHRLSEDMPFEIECKKVAIGPIIKSLSPKVSENDSQNIERIFSYMELVRELDRDRLFIMVNMRSYFSEDEMNNFAQSVVLHDYKLLFIESTCRKILKNTQRYIIDDDLCEF